MNLLFVFFSDRSFSFFCIKQSEFWSIFIIIIVSDISWWDRYQWAERICTKLTIYRSYFIRRELRSENRSVLSATLFNNGYTALHQCIQANRFCRLFPAKSEKLATDKTLHGSYMSYIISSEHRQNVAKFIYFSPKRNALLLLLGVVKRKYENQYACTTHGITSSLSTNTKYTFTLICTHSLCTSRVLSHKTYKRLL